MFIAIAIDLIRLSNIKPRLIRGVFCWANTAGGLDQDGISQDRHPELVSVSY